MTLEVEILEVEILEVEDADDGVDREVVTEAIHVVCPFTVSERTAGLVVQAEADFSGKTKSGG